MQGPKFGGSLLWLYSIMPTLSIWLVWGLGPFRAHRNIQLWRNKPLDGRQWKCYTSRSLTVDQLFLCCCRRCRLFLEVSETTVPREGAWRCFAVVQPSKPEPYCTLTRNSLVESWSLQLPPYANSETRIRGWIFRSLYTTNVQQVQAVGLHGTTDGQNPRYFQEVERLKIGETTI